jgi:hypothetical protein
MTAIRTHIYKVSDTDLESLIENRSILISKIRESHPGLTEARLVRLDDGTYSDTWHWASFEEMGAALASIGSYPEAPAAMRFVRENAAQNGTVVHEC